MLLGLLIALAIVGGVSAIAGTVVSTIGAVRETKGQAAQDRIAAEAASVQAGNLEELSATGGYYEQVLTSLELELEDIEADKAASAITLQLAQEELTAGLAQSELEEKVQVANLEGQIEGSKIREKMDVTQAAISGLDVSDQGAQAKGSIQAAAGAGNVGGQSILRQAESVTKQVGRRVAFSNMQGAAAKALGKLDRTALQGNISMVQGASDLEQMRIKNDMQRSRMQYEDTLRGLGVAESSTTAQQTRTLFEQESGMEEAGIYRQKSEYLTDEADWLEQYGVPLAVAGGIAQGAGDLASMGLGALKIGGAAGG